MTDKAAREQFGRRLFALMRDRGLHASELARRAGMQRNNISTYTGGRSFPSEENLIKLAQALDIKPEDLLPDFPKVTRRSGDEPMPDLAVKTSMSDPSKAWLSINRAVSTALAAKIFSMLEEERGRGQAS